MTVSVSTPSEFKPTAQGPDQGYNLYLARVFIQVIGLTSRARTEQGIDESKRQANPLLTTQRNTRPRLLQLCKDELAEGREK